MLSQHNDDKLFVHPTFLPIQRALVHFHGLEDNDRVPPPFPWAPDAAQTQR
jgi:hypothetical protein